MDEFVPKTVAKSNKELLVNTLRFCNGDKHAACAILEISLKTLYNWIKEYGLKDEFLTFRKGTYNTAPRSSENEKKTNEGSAVW